MVRACAYVAGEGYYELRINGEKVGRNVLDLAWTTYDKRVLYSTYDVIYMTDVTVREGDRVVFDKGQYVAGDPGITGATAEKNGDIIFAVGSGAYSFQLTGQ